MKKCLINVEGGLGKNVMLTAILAEFKKTKGYDELYVVSPYYDVFKCCPAVTEAYPPMQGTLYQELVLDKDCDVYWKEPYSNQHFIKKECHLFTAWAEELGFNLKHEADTYLPDLSKLPEAFPAIVSTAEQIKQKLGKKFVIVQFCGGQSPLSLQKDKEGHFNLYNDRQEALKRNYFDGQKVIDLIKEKYPDVTVLHFSLPNEPAYNGAVKVEVPYLTYALLAKEAEAVITIDSSLQHLSTGNCKNVTVIWGETRPEHFGYKVNKNICAPKVLNSQPYFKPLGVSPSMVKMPEAKEIVKNTKI